MAPITYILAFLMPGATEWIVLLVIGLLIFGRRLPEVGRSLGKGIVEFKKGIKGIEDDIEDASSATASAKLPDAQSPKLTEQATAPESTPATGESAETDPYRTAGEGA